MNTVEIQQSMNGKLTEVRLGNVVIWFSYETPVAYSVPGVRGVTVSDKGWSQTTRRHIGSIPGRRQPISHAEFEAGLAALMAKLTAPTALEALDARAEALYDRAASYRTFAREFTREELSQLAELCKLTPQGGGRAYDDEVFDAIAFLDAE